MNIYRKIWTNHNGPIPKDKDGRSYDIHHIDGDRKNNDISNLKCLSIIEHYNIHYQQGDFGACLKISRRLKLTVQEESDLARQSALKRIAAGTHNFLDPDFIRTNANNQVLAGTHNFLGGQIQKNLAKRLVDSGKHHWLGSNHKRGDNKKRLRDGTHPSQIRVSCIYCKENFSSPAFVRWHGDNCKRRIK